jgi:hypothetical protein
MVSMMSCSSPVMGNLFLASSISLLRITATNVVLTGYTHKAAATIIKSKVSVASFYRGDF